MSLLTPLNGHERNKPVLKIPIVIGAIPLEDPLFCEVQMALVTSRRIAPTVSHVEVGRWIFSEGGYVVNQNHHQLYAPNLSSIPIPSIRAVSDSPSYAFITQVDRNSLMTPETREYINIYKILNVYSKF